MKYLLIIAAGILLQACASKSEANESQENIGDTIELDGAYYVITSQDTIDGEIANHIKEISCATYDSLMQVIHNGENCRGSNAVALALAERDGDFERAYYFERMNIDAEEAMDNAIDELVVHLKYCHACELLGNE